MSNKQKAIFSGNIISAYYFDQDYTTIEILYKIKDETHNYVVEANPDNEDYQALVAEGWDTDKLAKDTEQYKKDQSTQFNNAVQDSIDALLVTSKLSVGAKNDLLMSSKNVGIQDISNGVFNFILEGNTNKDMLFKFKLWALELDSIKKSTKTVKSEIRKAKSLLAGMATIAPFINDNTSM